MAGKELPMLRITRDKRVLLDEVELSTCISVNVIIEAGRDPEAELRIAVGRVDIDDYTN